MFGSLHIRRSLAALTLVAFPVDNAFAEDDAGYLRLVKPVLKSRCFACHGALKQESGLRLDSVASMVSGGDGGPVVKPGDADASPIVERIRATDDGERMPPEGKPLTPAEIAAISKWISAGATAPKGEQPESDPRDHWAFRPPTRDESPISVTPESNPIDQLIERELDKNQLTPLPRADARILCRRIHLDLIGMPPTLEQVRDFATRAASDHDAAVRELVDRLLSDTRHAERWARHWMDIWRYTDWYGLGAQLRNSQKHIWHWRDWIIDSLAADVGYDDMIVHMLAADEVAPTDQDALRASGFLARQYYLFNRTTWLDSAIEHTSKAFLGLTFNCAKCHDHKYDPISQVDYYRMRAIFEPYQVRLDAVPGETDLERDGLPRAFDAHPDAPTWLHIRGNEKEPDKSQPIAPGLPSFLAPNGLSPREITLPAAAHTPSTRPFVLDDQLAATDEKIRQREAALNTTQRQLAALQARDRSGDSVNPLLSGELILHDDFSAPNPDAWETVGGEWAWKNGKLIQSHVAAQRAVIRSRVSHPRDFAARLRFRTTGGNMWKSVGLCFDAHGSRHKQVYMSAYRQGPKVQVSWDLGSGAVYPAEGRRSRPVNLDRDYELLVAVRGRLINVLIDDRLQLVYELPIDRTPGQIEVSAFDAVTEFDEFEIRHLPEDTKLAAMSPSGPAVELPATTDEAKLAETVARLELQAVQQERVVIRASHAADVARYGGAPTEEADRLVRAAALATRQHAVVVAETSVAKGELSVAKADSDDERAKAEKSLKAAKDALAKSRRDLEKPGTNYTPIRASRKALEGPAEKDDSRYKPYPTTSTGRRFALARWIASRDNPLTARVAVNHIWLRHFGQPLVESVADFGRRAPVPVQHELLDWLAAEFVESGWSMKHLHRLIITSRAWQRSSSVLNADRATLVADAENHFYWRRRPVRMESEVIRDSLLYLAGSLETTVGGPPIDPNGEDTANRRSLYFRRSRDHKNAFMSMFDDADLLQCYRRTESIKPQQSLALVNAKLAMSAARRLTERLNAGLDDSSDEIFIRAAWETILIAEPTDDEVRACREFLAETRANLTDTDQKRPARAKENLVHALINHNDFITIR